ncbi:conserved hypothetical protein [uncultured Desulfovibrio sp.]|uniref:Anti-CBASS protein Acb1-like N-terminal domain-containing protein n=2 Tax=uncultured Desulfovibrio sp. TaxID=167968 RepID=A0A212KEM8_9BACT|nr:conserved hypothetical protein [uncultured Desulfovibrio sp.]
MVKTRTSRPALRATSRRSMRDGFQNFAAKLGLGQDNMLAKSGYEQGAYLTRDRQQLDDMYRTSWLVGRTVNVVAEDMVRGGVDVRAQWDAGRTDELLREHRRTGCPGRLSDAIKWGRLYGGALAVLLIDGDDLSTPLEIDSIIEGSFLGLHVLDRWQVQPSSELITDLGPMLGYPEYYDVNTTSGMNGERIHHSRALRFVGVELPYQQRITEQHWGASVVEQMESRMLAYDSATEGSANLLYKSFLRVIGVDGLRSILAAGGKAEQALIRQFEMVRQMQSNEGITLLDKNDTFTTAGYSFAGVYDAMQAFAEQIAGATGIPLVRLLGQSPKGFSTGESDLRTYYDTIATLQDDDLRPALNVIFAVLSRHLWGESLPDGFSFEFESLMQPSELEKSQIATSDAQAVAALVQGGIITPSQGLAALRDSARVTGRFAGISDADIDRAEKSEQAPPLSPLPTQQSTTAFAPLSMANGNPAAQ